MLKPAPPRTSFETIEERGRRETIEWLMMDKVLVMFVFLLFQGACYASLSEILFWRPRAQTETKWLLETGQKPQHWIEIASK